MLKKLIVTSLILFFFVIPLSKASNVLYLFDRHIHIPSRFKLEVENSLSTNELKYRTGNFDFPATNGRVEMITIGLMEDYLAINDIQKMTDVAPVIDTGKKYKELRYPKSSFGKGNDTMIIRVFFNDKHYIRYLILAKHIDDIAL